MILVSNSIKADTVVCRAAMGPRQRQQSAPLVPLPHWFQQALDHDRRIGGA
jgi:hypothetical protein